MGRPPRGTISQRDQIVMALTRELVGGRRTIGAKMPSLRMLAARFRIGIKPIEKAMALLERQGYVERRHGSGVYVRNRPKELSMADTALLCMGTTGHVHAELVALLHGRLQQLGLLASRLDTSHGNTAELLPRALYSDARFVLVTAGASFPFHLLDKYTVERKCLIAVLAWESDVLLDRVHRVVVDHAAGSALVVEHLWSAGHRHVLLAGPDDMIARAAQWDGQGKCPSILNLQGAGLAGLWARRGGTLTPLVSLHDDESGRRPQRDEGRLLAILTGAAAPTAVVGIRDVDAWDVRESLRRLRLDLLNRLTLVGNGDTPWSRTSYPPFTTLSWDLDKIADMACAIIRDIEAGKTFKTPVVRLIPPRRVVR